MINNIKYLVLLFTIINIHLFIFANESKLAPTFGVNPEVLSFYKGKTFGCLAHNKEIPIEQVNDDYCDCLDGTDEPGTSACAKGVFYCVNKGYKPTSISTSFLNDAYCDCCDGSDEYIGIIKCPNTCDELGKELKDKRQKEIDNFTIGLSKKAQLESEAKDILKQKSDELEVLKKEIEPLNQEIKEITTRKNEKSNEKENEIEALEKEREKNKQQEEVQEKQIEEDQQDKVVEGSDIDEPLPEKGEDVSSPALDAIKQDDEKKQVNKDEDYNEEDNSFYSQIFSLIFDIYPNIWDLIKYYLPSNVYKSDDLNTLEAELSSKRESLREKQDQIQEIEKLFTLDFGSNNVYLPLYGKCFDVKTKEYTYSFCLYDKASQAHTSLGKYEKWDHDHSKMLFTNGASCWGIKTPRSLTVTFECGQDNEAYNVEEPGKCEYTMRFKTPAACDEEHLKILKLDNTHEL